MGRERLLCVVVRVALVFGSRRLKVPPRLFPTDGKGESEEVDNDFAPRHSGVAGVGHLRSPPPRRPPYYFGRLESCVCQTL